MINLAVSLTEYTGMKIRFNRPYLTGNETHHLTRLAYLGKFSGNGHYTTLCHQFFRERFGFKKVLLTTSCTDALEMAAILSAIEPGDEVIMPSYTFVSTANAFVLRGAKIIFADVQADYPNIDVGSLEELITTKTKAIVVIHYAGVACDMDRIMEIASRNKLVVIEDAAHAIDSYYKGKVLGSIGDFGTFSFHETKNIISGEGGMISINRDQYLERAEHIWEKGTNRAAFARGEVQKYEWVDVGSSYLPSEVTAGLLYAQLEEMDTIQKMRKSIWHHYVDLLRPLASKGYFNLPEIPSYATVNGNMFFIVTSGSKERDSLLEHLKRNSIQAVFHYLPLHRSRYYSEKHDGRELKNTEMFSSRIIRLPFYNRLTRENQEFVASTIKKYYEK